MIKMYDSNQDDKIRSKWSKGVTPKNLDLFENVTKKSFNGKRRFNLTFQVFFKSKRSYTIYKIVIYQYKITIKI